MESLFDNKYMDEDNDYKINYEKFFETKTDVNSFEVSDACEFLNNYFDDNYYDELGDYAIKIFTNNLCAYYAAILKILFPKGMMIVLNNEEHVMFSINTLDRGVLSYDASIVLEGIPDAYKFSTNHDWLYYERENRARLEKMCFEAIKAYTKNKEKTK